ncbi:MAG: M24 family metallopeptidase, partial [Rubellimicrobium sp.]|nr:M24 family metallopeptidase [Rubellimicrobium sp.]
IGARAGDFSSDITRMAVLGDGPAGYDEVHAVVEAAVQAALGICRPGVRASELDRAARAVIEEAGFGPQFMHRLGHGMGLEGHEPPWISESSDAILQPGMVFSIEPGIYLEDRFGLRLEDIVILQEDGPEVLSRLPLTGGRFPCSAPPPCRVPIFGKKPLRYFPQIPGPGPIVARPSEENPCPGSGPFPPIPATPA